MMKTLLRALALTLCLGVPAFASNLPGPFPDASIGATNCTAACDTIVVLTNGTGAAHFSVTGSGTGLSYIFQGFNGTNWATAPYCSTNAYPPTCDVAALTAQTGEYSVPVHGFQRVRLHLTTIGGGTLTGSADAGAGSAVVLIAGAVSASGTFTCSACALETGGNLATLAGAVTSSKANTRSYFSTNNADAQPHVCGSTSTFKHITGSADTQLLAASGSTNIYVCDVRFSASAALNFYLEKSSSGTCGSPTQIDILVTAAANEAHLPSAAFYQGLNTGASQQLCVNTSGGNLDISVIYDQY